MSINTFGALQTLSFNNRSSQIFALDKIPGAKTLPFSLKILLENLLRTEDGVNITKEHINAVANWDEKAEPSIEIPYTPARVIMQDFTGVPAIVELATFDKTILAGVSGYSAKFIKDEIKNSFVFNPCDFKSLVDFLLNYESTDSIDRSEFVQKFKRTNINNNMASSILTYL